MSAPEDPRYPLSAPVNRAPSEPPLHPIPGRPNWWSDGQRERYIEPVKST